MKRYKHWLTAGMAITMIGVLVGCGIAGSGSAPTTNTTTNTATTNTTATNNVVTGTNNTVSNQVIQNTTNTTGTAPTKNSSISSIPNYPYWSGLTSASDKSTVKTDYGTVSFSQLGITKNAISVFLASSGVRNILYKFSEPGFKQADGWQLNGSYLALQFGLPYNAHPNTGDYSYQDVVINLKTRKVVLTTGSSVQSQDYLDVPYFVETSFETASNGTPEFFITITNLSTQKDITYQLPNNAVGKFVESGGVLYYTVANGKKQQIISMVLPKEGWKPISDNKWNPIQLPSKS